MHVDTANRRSIAAPKQAGTVVIITLRKRRKNLAERDALRNGEQRLGLVNALMTTFQAFKGSIDCGSIAFRKALEHLEQFSTDSYSHEYIFFRSVKGRIRWREETPVSISGFRNYGLT